MNGWLSMQKTITIGKVPEVPPRVPTRSKPIGEFRKTGASACKRAGVPELLFHDLRRPAIRNMRLAGIAENVAMQISGHLTRPVLERYNIVSSRDPDEAATLMEKRLTKELGTIRDSKEKLAQAQISNLPVRDCNEESYAESLIGCGGRI
jgi:hypothetical protein